jgi:hypothetical protein
MLIKSFSLKSASPDTLKLAGHPLVLAAATTKLSTA